MHWKLCKVFQIRIKASILSQFRKLFNIPDSRPVLPSRYLCWQLAVCKVVRSWGVNKERSQCAKTTSTSSQHCRTSYMTTLANYFYPSAALQSQTKIVSLSEITIYNLYSIYFISFERNNNKEEVSKEKCGLFKKIQFTISP